MSVKIRMTRTGRKKQPFYHIVVADERMPRDGRFIEKLGFYNPMAKEHEISLKWNAERVNHWLDQGAQPTDRIAKFIITEKLGNDKQRAKMEARYNGRVKAVQDKIAAVKAAEEAKVAAEKAAADAKAAEEAAAAAAAAAASEAEASEAAAN